MDTGRPDPSLRRNIGHPRTHRHRENSEPAQALATGPLSRPPSQPARAPLGQAADAVVGPAAARPSSPCLLLQPPLPTARPPREPITWLTSPPIAQTLAGFRSCAAALTPSSRKVDVPRYTDHPVQMTDPMLLHHRTCPITLMALSQLTQPILWHRQDTIVGGDFHAVRRWLQVNPTDPETRGRLRVEDLFRPSLPAHGCDNA